MKTFLFPVIALALVAQAAAVPSVGPDYQRPDAPAPIAYRDVNRVQASRAEVASEWWTSFGDPALDALEARALAANQDLRGALARVEQARAIAGVARSAYLPSLAIDADQTRQRTSEAVANIPPEAVTTTYRAPAVLSWEIDLFGRVRRLNESARADLAAADATFAAARLSLTAEVATTYFTLRALDRELAVVKDTVGVRRSGLELAQARYNRGNAGDLDVARAETELAATEADALALARRRSSTQNALAVLLGEVAPAFTATLAARNQDNVPVIPAGLPSELLTRRPDIAAAERNLASANARIGLAKAAFFPAISLTGAAGYASSDIDNLFQHGSRLWAIGPSIYLPLFQGGRNRANLARSRAVYEETLAGYQQRVLVAFREVQDALTASQLLSEQAEAQVRAVASARRGATLSQKRYDAGFVSYLEVVDAQRTALAIERADAQLTGQRWITHVALIKALGGGWQRSPGI